MGIQLHLVFPSRMQATLQNDGAGKELDNLKLLESMGLEVPYALLESSP